MMHEHTCEHMVAALEAVANHKQMRVVFAEDGETDGETLARVGVCDAANEIIIVLWV